VDDAWRRVNHTELYQACRQAGLYVHPNSSNEELVGYLTGEKEPDAALHPIDDWRDAIMRFVLDYWKKVHVQLKCPAGTGDPKACYGCIDSQVIACLVQSKGVEKHIENRRRGK
jgi:hypothetical protein